MSGEGNAYEQKKKKNWEEGGRFGLGWGGAGGKTELGALNKEGKEEGGKMCWFQRKKEKKSIRSPCSL